MASNEDSSENVKKDKHDVWPQFSPENDFINGISAVHIWHSLALHDIRQRYRRSVIGPFNCR